MPSRFRPLLLALALQACLSAPAAQAEDVPLPPPASEAWRTVPMRRARQGTEYSPAELDGLPALHARSRCGASMRVLAVDSLDLARTPWLHWRWRAEELPGGPDERSRGGDDFAARVYVAFHLDPEHATLLDRMRVHLAEQFYAHEVPGTVLSFVWSSQTPPGEHWLSPFSSSTRITALERGASPAWRSESVNVIEAYRTAFDRDPPRLQGVGLMSDSDNACREGAAWFAGFSFSSEGASGQP